MATPKFRSVLLLGALALVLWAYGPANALGTQDAAPREAKDPKQEKPMLVQYLEVVTPDVDATCTSLEKLHGVRFSAPEAALGNARTAPLKGGGRIGVRAPMRADEEPVVRPYVLVDDIEAAVKSAQAAGGDFAVTATEIPGQGKFAIYFQGGIQHGLWQN
jgi:predicted enzyme related to lactoylglutathione lyase